MAKKKRNKKKSEKKKVTAYSIATQELVEEPITTSAEKAKKEEEDFRPEELHLIHGAIKFYKEYWSKSIDLNEPENGDALEKMINIRDAYEHIEKKFLSIFATEE